MALGRSTHNLERIRKKVYKFYIGIIIFVILFVITIFVVLILSNNYKQKIKYNRTNDHVMNFLSNVKYDELESYGVEIIDATYSCVENLEKFYEDDKYIYSFPCVKSKSIFVKFENGNKMLVVDALEDEKVTIDELIAAGLDVRKNTK